jgi:hypothetical protein
MRRSASVLSAVIVLAPLTASAQGYSVVGGGSTHADAPPASHSTSSTAGSGGNDATPGAAQGSASNAASSGSASVTPAVGSGASNDTSHGGVTSTRHPWEYAGLTPGATNARIPGLNRREARRAGNRAVIAWPGFQMTPNGSRVFVATTRPVVVGPPHHTPGRWTYVVSGAYIPLSNNRRPLVTQAFETPVDRAYVRQRGHDAEIVIEMQGDTQPQMSQQNDAAGGLSYIFFDFQRWTPPNHIPRALREGAGLGAGQGGVRLSPGQEPAGTPAAPVVDEERPPPVQR